MNATNSGRRLRVLVAGASGLVGSALVPSLRADGHEVRRLVRRAAAAADEVAWQPERGELNPAALEGIDAVINLCGENVAAGRWTAKRRAAIRASRLEATRTLVEAMRRAGRGPAVLLNASATGIYGDTGERVVAEDAPAGSGFLAEVCRDWEAEAGRARELGVRVVCLRFGVVLTPAGGALEKMLPVFRLGLGGRMGSGRQWMSWVGIDDAVGAIHHALNEPRCAGPVNVVAPEPVTNTEFTAALGRVLRRSTVLTVPAFLLRGLFGQMADEALLASTRTEPGVLWDTGYRFRQGTAEVALRHALANNA